MIQTTPLQIQTLYQDLVDAHVSRPAADVDGAPFTRVISGKSYWYTNERVGARMVQHYFGPDDEATRQRMNNARIAREEAKVFERRTSDMVAQLRAARLPAKDADTGRLLTALARSGVFGVGGTLVGTHAFRLYDAEVGRRVTQAAPAQTEDVDIASFQRLSLAMAADDAPPVALTNTLAALDLEPAPTTDPKGRTGRWRRKGGGVALELLAPSFSEEEGIVRLEVMGVWAQSLHFLNYLIADPIPAVALYRAGVLVRIPRPERYAIHKLIVAQRRQAGNLAKRRKDLAQAAALIEALAEDRRSELRQAFDAAMEAGPEWRAAIEASLSVAPASKLLLSGL
jgi:hypothetical protein